MTCIDSGMLCWGSKYWAWFLVACIPTRLLTGKFNNSCQKMELILLGPRMFLTLTLAGNLLLRQVKCHSEPDWYLIQIFHIVAWFSQMQLFARRMIYCHADILATFPHKHLMRPNTWTWKKCAWNLSDNSFNVNYVARASGKHYFLVCLSCRSEKFLVIIWEACNGCNL